VCRHGADGHDGGLLVRLGVGSIAAGLAAIAGFISYMWLTLDSGPADAGSRAGASDLFVAGSIHPKPGNPGTAAVGADMRGNSRLQLAGLETGDSAFAFKAPDDQSEPSARSPFGERFAFHLASVPSRFTRPSQAAGSFDDRFSGEVFATGTAVRSAAAAPPAAAPRVAAAAAAPRAAARSVVAQVGPNQVGPNQVAPKRPPEGRFQLASASGTSLPLGYAPTDSVKGSAMGTSLKGLTSKDADPLGDTSRTAIYDITARTVYLPSGRRLEAHSGLGEHMDDLRYVNVRMKGPTPPNVYQLKMRESLFHGVRAIRLIPTDDTKMYGRAGILAHSYMLGPSGQSNGCVSFSNYAEFLDAYQRGEITRLVVVERLAEAPSPKTASDWLKDIFRGS
jgi:Protein of unknown function (DUF2778)